MPRPMRNTCPHCGSIHFAQIAPPQGSNSYVITTMDTTTIPPSFNPAQGMAVTIYGCLDCGICMIYNPLLSSNPLTR